MNGNAGSGSLNGGSLTYTGKKGTWNLNGGATSSEGRSLSLPPPGNPLPSFASTFQPPLTALSSQLAALTPSSSVLISGNSVTLEAKPDADGIAVLDLSTSVFAPNDPVSVALNGATSFIINLSVAGCSKNCSYSVPNSVNFQNPTNYADSVLWNITDVSSLSFTNEFGGSVLAPSASVTNSGPDRRRPGRTELQRQRRVARLPLHRPAADARAVEPGSDGSRIARQALARCGGGRGLAVAGPP